jgi:tetratricopeptide (TPR) repeat protein
LRKEANVAAKINKGKVIAAAQKHVQKGQYDKAIREYRKVVEEDPRDVRIWLKIGDIEAKKGASDEAIDTYLKVAEFYSEQGFYLKAVAVYKQILKLKASLVDVNLKLAELYKQLGLLNDAMQQYEIVSNHYHQAGRTKDALAALRQIVDLDPENVASRIKLAELYSKEEMKAEAIEEFSKAADYLRASNRIDDFIKVAERLVYHQPDNVPVTKELASLYLRRKDPRRALQKLQVAFKVDPRAEDTLEMLAHSFLDLGQTAKTVSVWRELAQIHAENGQPNKQRETYERIIELDPNDQDARRLLASLNQAQPQQPAGKPPPPPSAAHTALERPAPGEPGQGPVAPIPSGPISPVASAAGTGKQQSPPRPPPPPSGAFARAGASYDSGLDQKHAEDYYGGAQPPQQHRPDYGFGDPAFSPGPGYAQQAPEYLPDSDGRIHIDEADAAQHAPPPYPSGEQPYPSGEQPYSASVPSPSVPSVSPPSPSVLPPSPICFAAIAICFAAICFAAVCFPAICFPAIWGSVTYARGCRRSRACDYGGRGLHQVRLAR